MEDMLRVSPSLSCKLSPGDLIERVLYCTRCRPTMMRESHVCLTVWQEMSAVGVCTTILLEYFSDAVFADLM
jgi:hypothetical protein